MQVMEVMEVKLNENIEKTDQTDVENKKDGNPLSVRINPYYKEIFEDLIKQKGVPKKVLLETMISSYVESGREDGRESSISFVNEINLIAGSFNEIMNIFKSMAAKSQDTIGSQMSFYEQKVKNIETKMQILETDYKGLKEKNKLLETTDNNLHLEKEKLEKIIYDLNEVDASGEKEISTYLRKNAELLEQINSLQKVEKESVILNSEYEKVKYEIKALKSALDDKINENGKLHIKISDAEETILEMRNKRINEFKDIELVIRKEAEVDKKMEILKLQLQYNELQAEDLKNLGIINKHLEEISKLKIALEKATK
jgi:chromosome segregation ATPase